jgi:predicted exporter
VDYGVFVTESGATPGQGAGHGATLVSLVLCCLSSVLGFGLLAASSNPALHGIGVTTTLGVTFALLLAPTTWLMLAGKDRDG